MTSNSHVSVGVDNSGMPRISWLIDNEDDYRKATIKIQKVSEFAKVSGVEERKGQYLLVKDYGHHPKYAFVVQDGNADVSVKVVFGDETNQVIFHGICQKERGFENFKGAYQESGNIVLEIKCKESGFINEYLTFGFETNELESVETIA